MSDTAKQDPIEVDESAEFDHGPQKKRGRPKNDNYLSFAEAKEFVQGELIPSRGKYFEWWDRNKPKAIPRFPYRVYVKEWVSWNDFLGTKNKFNDKIGTKWRPLNEAIAWVHALKISGYAQWMEYCKNNTLPADIPTRPDLVYATWRSWNHWLGNKPAEAIEAKQEATKTQVYFLIRDLTVPENVITFGVEPMGVSGLKERWEREHFDVIKMFWYDPQHQEQIDRIINALSTPYMDSTRQRIVPNFWEIVYYLQQLMSTVVIR